MKKGLIGIVVLALVALVCVPTFAATFETVDFTATMEWTIFDETGFMPGTSYPGSALTAPSLTLEAGPWSASTGDGYIKYTAEMGAVGFYASTSYDIYDFGVNIGANQGFTLAGDLGGLSVDGVYTAAKEYGVGGSYAAEMLTVGGKYNSTGAYGVQLVYPIVPITLTGQYVMGPTTMVGALESGYKVQGVYALNAGTITVYYKSTKAPLLVPTTTELSAALADFPITDTTLLGASVASTGGITTTTTVTGTTTTTLAENVTLTLNVASTAGTMTYSGKIGVAL